MIVIAFEAT